MKRGLILMLLALTTSSLFALTLEVHASKGVASSEEPTEIVDQMPMFKGEGYNQFKSWLREEVFFRYIKSKANEVSGEVHAQFIIEKSGAISAVEILESPNEALSKCVIKALSKTQKKLSPAIKDGAPVRFRASLNIIFSATIREAGYYPQGVLMSPNTTLVSSTSVALGSSTEVKDGGDKALHDNHKTLLHRGDTTKMVLLKRGVSYKVIVKDLHLASD